MSDGGVAAAALDVDVAILGGGLSGGLCALAMAKHAPGLSVALVEQADRLAGNHTWCCHGSDVATSEGKAEPAWFRPLVKHRWRQYQVKFPDFERSIDGDYLCIPADALEFEVTRAMARAGHHLLLGQPVRSTSAGEVVLESGLRLRARLVLDARGSRTTTSRSGYQKFLGWEIETKEAAPQLGGVPTLMDASVQQLDGYRFIYVLPMSSTRFLVEDTYFSRTPVLDREMVSGRLRKHLGGLGVRQYRVVREERGVLPMPWSAGSDPEDEDAAPLAIGYRAGLFHPATGYSLGLAVQTAERIARAAAATQPETLRTSVAKVIADFRTELASDLRFARALNLLAFRAIPGDWLRSLVFAAVYRLPAELLERFYAARTNARDRLSLLGAVARVPWPRLPMPSTPLNGETP